MEDIKVQIVNKRNFELLEEQVSRFLNSYANVEYEIDPCVRSSDLDDLCSFCIKFYCMGVSHSTVWFGSQFFELDKEVVNDLLTVEFNRVIEEITFYIGKSVMAGNFDINLRIVSTDDYTFGRHYENKRS